MNVSPFFSSVLSALNLSQHIYYIQPKRKSSVPPTSKGKKDRSALTSVPAQIDEGGMHTLGAYRTWSSFPSLRYLQSGSELASFYAKLLFGLAISDCAYAPSLQRHGPWSIRGLGWGKKYGVCLSGYLVTRFCFCFYLIHSFIRSSGTLIVVACITIQLFFHIPQVLKSDNVRVWHSLSLPIYQYIYKMSVALLERSVVSSPSEISIDMRNMSTLANPAAAAAARTSTPDRKSLQRIAAEALHTKSVTIDRIHGTLFRNYKLQPSSHSAATTEETFYILKCRPSSPAIRLLRHEEDRLRTEAYTLQTLLLLLHSSSSAKPSEMPSTRMIPRLIASSPHHHHHRTNTTTTPLDPSPYILTGPFHGHLLSEISPRLPQTLSEKIQQRVGFFYRTLTTSFSPFSSSSSSTQQQPQPSSSYFGPLYPSSSSYSDSTSFTTWSQFYTTLLETLLLDAEDALINLPYSFIRETVRRNRNSLDQITKPKLVFLEGLMDERNIVVVRRRRLESNGGADERRESEDEWEISGILDWSGVIWGDEWMSDGFYDHFSKGRSLGGFLEGFLGGKGQQQNQRRSGEEVVRQYLYVFFFFFLFSLFPSPFYSPFTYSSIDDICILFGSTNQNNPSSSLSLTSSPHSHHNRYILYHSLLAIIRQCYRPSSSSSSSSLSSFNNNEESQQTELAARRNLTNALTQLSKICNFEVR